MTINVVSGRKMPGHHRRATGGTDPASHGEAVKVGAFFGEAVDIGGFKVGMSVATKITPAPVICKDENDIWAIFRKNR